MSLICLNTKTLIFFPLSFLHTLFTFIVLSCSPSFFSFASSFSSYVAMSGVLLTVNTQLSAYACVFVWHLQYVTATCLGCRKSTGLFWVAHEKGKLSTPLLPAIALKVEILGDEKTLTNTHTTAHITQPL